MENNIFIKARSDGRIYNLEKGNLEIKIGDSVLFESDSCQEVAQVVCKNKVEITPSISEGKVELIRRFNEKDEEIDAERKKEARENLAKCREIVSKHDLPMELLDADLSYDGKKLTFYFSAPSRVDFRSLVSELASTFQKLIRLQQVGARDHARMCGGIGRCGEEFCCKRFLQGELECVSTDMAYDQNLGMMGPNRTTGACGKLMCCLKYELDFYKKAKETLPSNGDIIKTARGKGKVIAQNILKNSVMVSLEDQTTLEVDCTKS